MTGLSHLAPGNFSNMPSTVAIITRTRNRPLLLQRAIQSVLRQNYPNWIHVIVNDGGDPQAVKTLVESHDVAYARRLIVITHPNSLGMEAASNAGIRASQSDYLLIHDDDDSLEPDFLKKTVEYLDNPPWPQISGVVSFTNRIDEIIDGNTVHETGRSLFKKLGECIRIDDVALLNPFPPISFLFARKVLDEIGLYDDKLPVLGDWDFNLRFIMRYDIGVIKEPLANYHHRPTIKQGQMGNSVHAQSDLHAFYDTLVRNRFLRMMPSNYIGMLMLQNRHINLLERLYKHPVIGRCIRLWSRWVNPSIPMNLP